MRLRDYLLQLLKETLLNVAKVCDRVINSDSEYFYNKEMTSSDLISYELANTYSIIILLNYLKMDITPSISCHLMNEDVTLYEMEYRIKNIFKSIRTNKDLNVDSKELNNLESMVINQINESKKKLAKENASQNFNNFAFIF